MLVIAQHHVVPQHDAGDGLRRPLLIPAADPAGRVPVGHEFPVQVFRQLFRVPGQPLNVPAHVLLQPSLPGVLLQLRHRPVVYRHLGILSLHVQDEKPCQSGSPDVRQIFPGDDRHAPRRPGLLQAPVGIKSSSLRPIAESSGQPLRRRVHLPLFLLATRRMEVVHPERRVLANKTHPRNAVPGAVEVRRRVLGVPVAEMAHGQSRERGFPGLGLSVQEQRICRRDARLAHPFPQRRQEHRPQQRNPVFPPGHVEDPQALPRRFLRIHPLEFRIPPAVQPVTAHLRPQVDRDTLSPDRPALEQITPFIPDPSPPRMVVFHDGLAHHLADLFDAPRDLGLGGAPRHDRRAESPVLGDPSHAVQIPAADRQPLQLLPLLVPPVQHKNPLPLDPVIQNLFHPRDHREVAQRHQRALRVLADTSVLRPVSRHRAV